MREAMFLEMIPNFHHEILAELRAENIHVWQAYLPEHITLAFHGAARPEFAIVDAQFATLKMCIPLLEEFRRCFPDVPILQITGFALSDEIIITVKGKIHGH